jgi:hypothetical protein
MPFQILQHPNIKVGSYLRVFRDNLRVWQVEKVFADRLAELLVRGRD